MSLRKLIGRSAAVARWTMVGGSTLLALSSYFAYTTAGLDFESPTATGFEVHYLRLRWDEGATWVGLAVQPIPRPDRPLDWFDPGGTLLAAPTRPVGFVAQASRYGGSCNRPTARASRLFMAFFEF